MCRNVYGGHLPGVDQRLIGGDEAMWWGGRLDYGLALLALESVDFLPQALNFRLGVAQIGGHSFNNVAQPNAEITPAILGYAAEIKVIKYRAFSVKRFCRV